MKIVLSPAKSLNFDKALPVNQYSEMIFLKEASLVHEALINKKPEQLVELMDISENLAQLNWERNQTRDLSNLSLLNARPSVYAFDGDVYTGLDVYTLPVGQVKKMQDSLRILSGLYGFLKPLDLIQPYRLEMGTKLSVGTQKDLYAFWKEKVTHALNEELENDSLLINLASQEYFGVVDVKKLKVPVITPEFKDFKEGKLKIISFFAKKARGLMVRYILDHDIQDIEGLKGFNYDGYLFDASLSTNHKLVFTR
jgi:cytoplasmic iron level regulating protein YaaA (DUF328/UPF0246 family)